MKVLIIIPAYNEGENLPKLLTDIKAKCPENDILVVNDCSKDNTAEVCKKNKVEVVDLPVNLGIGGAVQAGYKYAFYNNYDVAVQVDGDGQHNPEYIRMFVDKLKEGCNLCIGSRFIEKEGFQSTFARRAGIIFLSRLIRLLTNQRITDPTSGFRACDRKTIEYFAREYPRDYPEPETIVWATRRNLRIYEMPVVMNEREGGTSSITTLKSLYYMIKVSLAIIAAAFSKAK